MPDITNDVPRSIDDKLRPTLDEDARRGERDDAATDDGHTSGGGSLGHDQPADVERDTPIRNATGSDADPVMPADDATLNTKI
jgi:hypothetical protein